MINAIKERVKANKVEKAIENFENFVECVEAIASREDLFERYANSVMKIVNIATTVADRIETQMKAGR